MVSLFIIVLIDSIGFGIILPLLPVFGLKFALNGFELGLLTSIFAFTQLITAPILGAISDKIGRKYVITFSLFIIAISYYILSISHTFVLALFSRALAGMFTGNVSVALAAATDLSNNNNRTQYIAWLGAASGIGFMLGPILGGFLAGDDIQNANLNLVFFVAFIVTLLATFVALFFLKETLIHSKNHKFDFLLKIKRTTWLIWANKHIMFLIYLSILMWFAFASVNIFLTTWVIIKYHLSPQQIGVIATLFATFSAIMLVISPKFISGAKAILLGFQISALSTICILFESELYHLAIILFFLAIGIGILYPNLNSTLSLYGSKLQKGFILGVSQSAGTLGQTLGPLVVGFLYSTFSPNYAWITISLTFFIASLITLSYMLSDNTKKIRIKPIK